MALRERLLPWTQQPQEGGLRVNQDHPLANGLVFLALPGTSGVMYDLVSGTLGANTAVTGAVGTAGRASTYAGSGYSDWARGGLAIGAGTSLTFGALMRLNSATTAGIMYTGRGADGGAAWGFNGTGMRWVRPGYWGSGSVASVGVTGVVAAYSSTLNITGSNAINFGCYRDGRLIGTVSEAQSAPAIWTGFRIGDNNYSPERLYGDVFVAPAWARALTAEEHALWASAPWDLIEPQRIWVPVSAAGGGPIDATITGAALRTAARLTPGAVTAAPVVSISGASFRIAARLNAGSMSANTSVTVPGASLRTAARLTAGAVTAAPVLSIGGASLRTAARLTPGAMSASTGATISGASLRTAARLTAGGFGASPIVTGASLRAAARLYPGAMFVPGASSGTPGTRLRIGLGLGL